MDETCDAHEARYVQLGRAYAAALLTGDEVAAELAIRDAIEAKLTTAEIDDEIIAPALWLIGDLWQRGEITIAARAPRDRDLDPDARAPARGAAASCRARASYRVLLATPVAASSTSSRCAWSATLLREAGCQVVMLGADVPAGGARRGGARATRRTSCA